MTIDLDRIPTFFSAWIAEHGAEGPAGEVARWLAAGELEPAGFGAIVDAYGVAREPWFRANMLDFVLEYSRMRLSDGMLTLDDIVDVRMLKYALHIAEGEFVLYRPAEVSAILQQSLETILADDRIDDAEDLFLVGVQAAFDLSYDECLTLSRPAIERAVTDLEMRIANAESSGSASFRNLVRLRTALEPTYQLAASQYRSLGAPY